MRQLVTKLKPTSGFAHTIHMGLVVLLPITIFVLVRLNDVFIQVALAIILLSKWRMFAVHVRYWPANIRANGVDLIVGVSTLIFMIHTGSSLWQLVWALLYGVWLINIKPRTNTIGVSLQAIIGQLFGLMALFMEWPAAPAYGLVFGSGLICYVAARHFFDSFDEPHSRLLSYIWGYFGAALTWLLSHWLLFYGVVAQPTLLLSVIGYGAAGLYYLDHFDRSSKLLRRQFIFIMIAIVAVILTSANWTNRVV